LEVSQFLFFLVLCFNFQSFNVISFSVKVFNFQTSKHEAISGFNLVCFFLRITVFPKFVLVSVLRVEDVKLAVEDLVNYKDWQQHHPNNDGGHEYKTFVPFVVFTIA
jgi:hypothetical protein